MRRISFTALSFIFLACPPTDDPIKGTNWGTEVSSTTSQTTTSVDTNQPTGSSELTTGNISTTTEPSSTETNSTTGSTGTSTTDSSTTGDELDYCNLNFRDYLDPAFGAPECSSYTQQYGIPFVEDCVSKAGNLSCAPIQELFNKECNDYFNCPKFAFDCGECEGMNLSALPSMPLPEH